MTPKPIIRIEPFTYPDLEHVVRLHTACFTVEDNFAMRLGPQFLSATYEFFLKDPKSFGFVAKCDAEVIGVQVGRLDYYTKALNRFRMVQAFKAYVGNPSLIMNKQLFQQVVKVFSAEVLWVKATKKIELAPSHEKGKTATLASLCVHPNYRALKVASLLISTAEELCRKKGMRKVRTGVRRTNVASRFIFRSRGYIEDKVLSTDDVLYYLPLRSAQQVEEPSHHLLNCDA